MMGNTIRSLYDIVAILAPIDTGTEKISEKGMSAKFKSLKERHIAINIKPLQIIGKLLLHKIQICMRKFFILTLSVMWGVVTNHNFFICFYFKLNC